MFMIRSMCLHPMQCRWSPHPHCLGWWPTPIHIIWQTHATNEGRHMFSMGGNGHGRPHENHRHQNHPQRWLHHHLTAEIRQIHSTPQTHGQHQFGGNTSWFQHQDTTKSGWEQGQPKQLICKIPWRIAVPYQCDMTRHCTHHEQTCCLHSKPESPTHQSTEVNTLLSCWN